MRTLPLLTLVLLASATLAEDAVNDDIVKDVRALYAATKQKDIDSARQKLFARKDLDWPSVKRGLMEGCWYRDPLSTEYGTRHSGKNLRIRLKGDDGKERGFSVYVPKSYKAKDKIPVLVYLHHNSGTHTPNQGATLVHSALLQFRDAAEDYGVLFVAPYTCEGAEWWMPEGMRLVDWTLRRIKERYNIDENRVALMGSQDGASGVWYLGQGMPGTWSCLMPMSGNHYSVTALIRPLYLGTLDRMDVLIGVPGTMKGRLGATSAEKFLAGLKPMIGKAMRISTIIDPTAQGDFRYLPRVRDDAMTWVLTKKRKPLADEVDIETDLEGGQRSLWLELNSIDPEGPVPGHGFPSTRLNWTPPKSEEHQPKIGLHLQKLPHSDIGLQVTRASGAAMGERILGGDVLIRVGDKTIKETKDVQEAVKSFGWEKEIGLLFVREVKESELERFKKQQTNYMKMAARRRQLRAEGKPIPRDLMEQIESEGASDDEEEDDEGETTIEFGGGDEEGKAAHGKDESEKTVMVAFERFVYLRRPVAETIVRADFGAQRDKNYRGHDGVKVAGVIPGTLAWRAGFRNGDLITHVGGEKIDRAQELVEWFKKFKFEKEEKGKRFAEISVLKGGKADQDKDIHVSWEPVVPARVDAKWNKKENQLNVSVRRVGSFSVYFTDELIPPGEEFYLFINNVPYWDLVKPEEAPDYPVIDVGTDPFIKEKLRDMRRKRAKVPGWEPDIEFAVKLALDQRDRELIMGAKRTFDLKKMKAGFAAAKQRSEKPAIERAGRVKKAAEGYKAEG